MSVNSNENTERLKYIDGYKGIACLCIMLGHFCGIYKYSSDISAIQNGFMDVLTRRPFSFFTDENFWLVFFMLVSGYLCAKSAFWKIENLLSLIRYCAARFFRLAIPILFSCLIIYIIQITLGFHGYKLENIIHNKWFTSGYQEHLGIFDVAVSPFKTLVLGENVFVPPYWCLRDILEGTVIIYISDYIAMMFEKHLNKIGIYFVTIMAFSGAMILLVKPLVIVVLMGSLLSLFENYIEKVHIPVPICYLMLFAPVLAFEIRINSLSIAICFGLCLIGIKRISVIQKALEARPMKFLGELSWGIFSYHWAILSSVGAICFMSMSESSIAFMLMLMVSIVVTILISFIDYKCIVPLTKKVINWIK